MATVWCSVVVVVALVVQSLCFSVESWLKEMVAVLVELMQISLEDFALMLIVYLLWISLVLL